MRAALIHRVTPQWLEQVQSCGAEIRPGVWAFARPLGNWSWRYRLRAAWLVFTGRADALVWPGQ